MLHYKYPFEVLIYSSDINHIKLNYKSTTALGISCLVSHLTRSATALGMCYGGEWSDGDRQDWSEEE